MIRVDGVAMPSPGEYRVEYEDIGEFRRNANGDMVGDLVTVKARVVCGWDMLGDEDFGRILAGAQARRGRVAFLDPRVNDFREADMLIQPKGAKISVQDRGRHWWRDVFVEFIEW